MMSWLWKHLRSREDKNDFREAGRPGFGIVREKADEQQTTLPWTHKEKSSLLNFPNLGTRVTRMTLKYCHDQAALTSGIFFTPVLNHLKITARQRVRKMNVGSESHPAHP